MNDNWFEELEALKAADVEDFRRGNSIFIGLYGDDVKYLYSEFSSRYSASWLTTDKDGRTKADFLKWCTTAPIDKFRKE